MPPSRPALLATLLLAAPGCRAGTDVLPTAESWSSETPATDPILEPKDAGPCSATLTVGTVTRTPGCWVDEKVSNRSAALSYACGGGAATAPFGVPFEGTVGADGKVDLAATTTFRWDDGCTWQSHQRITGQLGAGTLTYGYREAPIRGSRCMPSHCVAEAKVSVR